MKSGVFLGLLVFVVASCSTVDYAPLYESKESEGVTAKRGLGPIYEDVRFPNGHVRQAVRPFWSYEKSGERVAEDFFWPLAMSRREKDYYKSHFLLLFYHNENLKNDKSAWMFWALPFWYEGRSRDGQDYKALLPFWGDVRDAMGYDLLRFRFFPFYLYTKKNNLESNGYLWPFISETHGDGLNKYRVFPFYGKLVKEGSHQNSFIMWPFWHEGQSLNPKKPGDWFLAWPFYGHYKYQDEEKYTVMWPFISWSTSDKETKKNAPWPFYTKRLTKDGKEESLSVWPFYARTTAPNKIYKSVMWPIATYSRLGDDKTYTENSWCLPFYWSSKKVDKGQEFEDYQRYWPLLSVDKAGGAKSVKFLSLWPQRHMPSIERNWEAGWELYRYFDNADITSHDVLWGMGKYRVNHKKDKSEFSFFPLFDKERDKENTSWSFLKGLIGRSELSKKDVKYRFLWLFSWTVDR